MYGTNEVAGPMYHEDGSLSVNEIWYTIQGEGPDAGCPAVFIRLAYCNLRCWFCDTEFDMRAAYTFEEVVQKVVALYDAQPRRHDDELVVITGGEPLLQNVVPLIRRLNELDIRVAIETAGTVCPPGYAGYAAEHQWVLTTVCSPKTPKISAELLPHITAFKYIVSVGDVSTHDGLPVLSTQRAFATLSRPVIPVYRPDRGDPAPIYVQACDMGPGKEGQTQDNRKHAAAIAMKYGYRVSTQTHKIMGVP